ncbi:Unknown protein [Striga hermonthica]|uniref:Replication protein A OB domain-containing protein n=1 Tax=Striga hermonthica TaxID=68872 RepID=A0A9N7NF97_STRHE|nr:Unknown protein [Striga hermonthica]
MKTLLLQEKCTISIVILTSIIMSSLTVNLLEINQTKFTIQLKVLRIGSESSCGQNGSSRIHKMIMVDKDGVHIGVIMWNDDIKEYANKFKLNNTYSITGAEVGQVNPTFAKMAIHPEKELLLRMTNKTSVNLAAEDIQHNISYNFTAFNNINVKNYANDKIDLCGIVMKAKESRIVTKANGAKANLREITIMDQEYRSIIVSLWDDMAQNEGSIVHSMVAESPFIAISNLISPKIYNGQLQMQTSASSLLQINTACEEYNHMRIWLQTHGTPVNIIEMSMARIMKDLDSITLQQIYYNRADIIEGKYYCLRGFVAKVMNKTSLWYESCKKCTSSVNKNDDNKMCKKCNDVVETTPRYRLVLNVVEANLSGTITLFEDVGMVYVGCSIEDYIRSIEQVKKFADLDREIQRKHSQVKKQRS